MSETLSTKTSHEHGAGATFSDDAERISVLAELGAAIRANGVAWQASLALRGSLNSDEYNEAISNRLAAQARIAQLRQRLADLDSGHMS